MENNKHFEGIAVQELQEINGGLGLIAGVACAVAITGGTAVTTYVAVKAVAKVGSWICDKIGL